MKAVGMLRRETLRASRVVSMNWEDGYDPEKDGGIQTCSPTPSSPTHCKYFMAKKKGIRSAGCRQCDNMCCRRTLISFVSSYVFFPFFLLTLTSLSLSHLILLS
jgi:hypothetical protein